LKSWDVLKTAEFAESKLSHDARILDIGAYASELPCVLHRLGFEFVSAIDLNPGVRNMPSASAIRYEVGSFLDSPYAEGSFDLVSAVSVIEHGYDGRRLFREVSRILGSGGFFVASFDYWPTKIDTRDTPVFEMDWRIFSREEVGEMLALAGEYGFRTVGAIEMECENPVINWGGRDYTFAWMALQKQ